MNYSRVINFVLIVLGGLMALFAQDERPGDQYILIGGIVLLMIGLYRVSRNISSRSSSKSTTDSKYVIEDDFDESKLKDESEDKSNSN
ncbi:MAG: hypothetical protein R3213_07370 [Flavobacteriaceae bacterium]|nr:hypothetical protein [Flavobacteriaceae bacterium]